jgi:hypothetical protein
MFSGGGVAVLDECWRRFSDGGAVPLQGDCVGSLLGGGPNGHRGLVTETILVVWRSLSVSGLHGEDVKAWSPSAVASSSLACSS